MRSKLHLHKMHLHLIGGCLLTRQLTCVYLQEILLENIQDGFFDFPEKVAHQLRACCCQCMQSHRSSHCVALMVCMHRVDIGGLYAVLTLVALAQDWKNVSGAAKDLIARMLVAEHQVCLATTHSLSFARVALTLMYVDTYIHRNSRIDTHIH